MLVHTVDQWLETFCGRMQAEGYQFLPYETAHRSGYLRIAHRTRFEGLRRGVGESFFVFADIPELTTAKMQDFSAKALAFAVDHREIPVPPSIFEHVLCYAVALTTHLKPSTAANILDMQVPAHEHTGVVPVAFDRETGQLAFLQHPPPERIDDYLHYRQPVQAYLVP